MGRKKVQVANNTHQIIIDYFATSDLILYEDAVAFYKKCEHKGMLNGTEAFDEAIEFVLKELSLDSDELNKLIAEDVS